MGLFDAKPPEVPRDLVIELYRDQVEFLKGELAKMQKEREAWDAQRMELIDTICLARGIPSPHEQRLDAEQGERIEQPVTQGTRHLSPQQLAIKLQQQSIARRNARLAEQQARANQRAREAGKQTIPDEKAPEAAAS